MLDMGYQIILLINSISIVISNYFIEALRFLDIFSPLAFQLKRNDFLACYAVLEHQINPLFTPPLPSSLRLYIGRNDKLFTGRILGVEATPGNARQEKIGATRREAVFKKFKRPVCQSRYISFASRNLDIAQSVISRRDLSRSFFLS